MRPVQRHAEYPLHFQSSQIIGALGIIGVPTCVPRSFYMHNSPSLRPVEGHASSDTTRLGIALEARLLGQDIVVAKKIAARLLPGVPPALRTELLARSLGYRTAAALQSGFKSIPAVPYVVATPLNAVEVDGPAKDLLSRLSDEERAKVQTLGETIITKILQDRFRVAKSAPNRIPSISPSKIADLGPLAAGTLAARRIMAEGLLNTFATAPLVIEEDDIREAWIAAGPGVCGYRVKKSRTRTADPARCGRRQSPPTLCCLRQERSGFCPPAWPTRGNPQESRFRTWR